MQWVLPQRYVAPILGLVFGAAACDGSPNNGGAAGSGGTASATPICNQIYALCDSSACAPVVNSPGHAYCTCSVQLGVSLGQDDCEERGPVHVELTSSGDWVIAQGAVVGQVVSEFSMLNAQPTSEGKVRDRDGSGADGNLRLKPCETDSFANCGNSPCSVLPPSTNSDKPVAVCTCPVVRTAGEKWYLLVPEEECANDGICDRNLWSGAASDLSAAQDDLAAYLLAHPTEDPDQNYRYQFCPE